MPVKTAVATGDDGTHPHSLKCPNCEIHVEVMWKMHCGICSICSRVLVYR